MNDELFMIRPYKKHHVFFKPIDNPLYHQHINFNDSSHHKDVYEGKKNHNFLLKLLNIHELYRRE